MCPWTHLEVKDGRDDLVYEAVFVEVDELPVGSSLGGVAVLNEGQVC